MENINTTNKSICNISNIRMYHGENNEIICLKISRGDWGDWDEKPEKERYNQHADDKCNSFGQET